MGKDYDIAADFWSRCASPLSLEEWNEANQKYKYRYAAIVHDKLIVAVAAVLPYSCRAWEVAAVGTDEAFRRQGNGKRIVSFVTASILEAVPVAACTTYDDNEPMIRTALSVGFEVVPEDEARQYREMIDAYFANFRVWESAKT